MAQTMRPSEDPACPHARKLEKSRTDDLELVMRRLATQDEIIAQVQADIQAVRTQVGVMKDMLITMGDLCYSLASAAERLSADS